MRHPGLCLVWIVLAVPLVSEVVGQGNGTLPPPPTTTARPTTTTEDPNAKEYGIILTTYAQNEPLGTFAQLRHLPVMPYYMNYSGPVPGLGFQNPYIHFLSLDIDYRMKQVYLYDYHLRSIAVGYNYHAEMDPQDMKFEFMHIGVSKGTIQVAVDWVTHMVYWSDSLYRWVVAAAGKQDKIQKDYYKIIIDKHLFAPEAIALDPLRGLMFVCDGGSHPKIEVATMTGTDRHTIISSGMHSPRALEADIFDQRIYWVDPYFESVYSANYDGSNVNRVKLIPESSLFDLAIFKDILCVTDIATGNLYSMNKTTGIKRATTVNFSPETLYSLAMYNIETQPMPDPQDEDGPCDELGCPHLCLQNGGKVECACSEGYTFNKKNNTCDEANYKTALVVASRTHICLIDARSFAYQTYREKCIFTVIRAPQKPLLTTQAGRNKRQVSDQPTTTAQPPSKTTVPRTQTPPNTPAPSTQTQPRDTMTTPKPTRPTTLPTTTTPAPTAAPEDEIAVFDLAMENRVIYYASASGKIYARNIDLPIETPANLDDPIVAASGNVSGLVFDWLSGENLYWCESDTGKLYVINEANRSPRRVSTSTFIGARDLVLMAHERMLAWIRDYSEIGVIQLDGTGQKVLVSGIKNAKYLVYEQHEKNLYWMNTDTDEIFSIGFNGEKQSLMHYTQRNAANMIIYKNYIAWTYEVQDYNYFVTYQRTGNNRRVSLGYFDQFEHIVNMKVLDTNDQPSEPDPCRYQNGNCEKICITRLVNNNPQKECLCPLGFTLKTDGMGCESSLSETEDSIFVTDWTNDAIFQVMIDGPKKNEIQAFQSTDAGTYLGVLYNKKDDMLYFGEHDTDMMYKSVLNKGEKKIHLDLAWADVENMALDEYTGNIYFTSSGWSYIGMVTPAGYEVELVDLGFDVLRGIAIHPGKGWLYYAVTLSEGWSEPKIVRIDMDGSNPKTILQGDDVPSPYGLAIDYNAGALYWSDMVTNVIQKCDLVGKNCEQFLRDYDASITDIRVDGEFLYYASMNRHHITQVRLDNSSITAELGSNVQLGRLTHLALKLKDNKNIQPVNGACKDNGGLGDCSTICLPNNIGPKNRRCACKYGIDLKDDDRFCEDVFQCDKIILQDPEITEVKFVGSCDRKLGEKCKYTCPAGFEPVNKNNVTLECLNDGWTRTSETLCKEIRCPEEIPNGNWKNCTRFSGDRCTYTCEGKLHPSKPFAVCTNEGIWDEDLDTLCTGHQCSAQIDNGQLAIDCQRVPGSPACSYSCNPGYKKNPDFSTLTCGDDYQWTANTSKACIEVTCPDTIANGDISMCNSYYPGSKCRYTCYPGFMKPPGVTQITCLDTGKWDVNGKSPCIGMCTNSQFTCGDGSCIDLGKKCDNTLDCPDNSDESPATCPPQCPNMYPNGAVPMDCDFTVGGVCNVTCNIGFSSQGIGEVACSITKTWQPSNICRPINCPPLIQGGFIYDKCGRSINSLCAYNCPLGFNKNPMVSSLKCLPSGQWNQTSDLCLEINVAVNPEGQSSSDGDGGVGKGIGIGIGLLALILVIAAVIGFIFYRRRKAYKETPYMASFDSGGSNVAIENPGYMANNNRSGTDDDHNYATVNLDQMQPTKFVGEGYNPPADHGMENPMYMAKHNGAEATLPDVGHVDLKNESTNVTHDSPGSPSTMKFNDWKNSQA